MTRRILEVFDKQFEVKESYNLKDHLMKDLGFQEIDIICLTSDLESEFDLSFTYEEIVKIFSFTLEQLVAFVKEKITVVM